MYLNGSFGVVFSQLKTKAPLTKGAFGLAIRPVTSDDTANESGQYD
jgi:hypothetical protein